MENESCANFRNYLKETGWPIDSVVLDPMPSLCYSIVHLACLLGKHKALEVLSEFGFHPVSLAAITDETPLHMVVRLLRHEWSGSIFLCDTVVSIVKTLSQHVHGMFLLSAKDYKGNTILHSLAEIISLPSIPVEVTLLCVYLLRVFVHLLLKELNPSVHYWCLSKFLTDCNKAGQTVELLLNRNGYGKQMYLRYVSGVREVTSASEEVCDYAAAVESSAISYQQTTTIGKSTTQIQYLKATIVSGY